MDVSAFVAKQVLRKLPIFDVLDSHTVGLIALRMRSVSCNAGYKLFQANDPAKEIYIQRSGKSLLEYSEETLFEMQKKTYETEENYLDNQTNSLNQDLHKFYKKFANKHHNHSRRDRFLRQKRLSDQNKKQSNEDGSVPQWVHFIEELERGAVCGELALAYKTRKYSLQCITWCEFYVVEIEDIWSVLRQEYPKHCLVRFFGLLYLYCTLFLLFCDWFRFVTVCKHCVLC